MASGFIQCLDPNSLSEINVTGRGLSLGFLIPEVLHRGHRFWFITCCICLFYHCGMKTTGRRAGGWGRVCWQACASDFGNDGAQKTLPGRGPCLAQLSMELTKLPPLSFPQGLLHHLPHDRHGQPLGKESPRKCLHVSCSRKLWPWQVR